MVEDYEGYYSNKLTGSPLTLGGSPILTWSPPTGSHPAQVTRPPRSLGSPTLHKFPLTPRGHTVYGFSTYGAIGLSTRGAPVRVPEALLGLTLGPFGPLPMIVRPRGPVRSGETTL